MSVCMCKHPLHLVLLVPEGTTTLSVLLVWWVLVVGVLGIEHKPKIVDCPQPAKSHNLSVYFALICLRSKCL